jgi:Domain of unknown function (DUF222)/HNH endonuclease
MTFQALRKVAADLRVALADLEPERLNGPDAARLLEIFSEVEKLASGGKLLVARRVETSNVWRRTGHRSAAAHIAEATGTGLGPAITTLKAARQLDSLPVTEGAMREGRLSETQVKEIAGAAIQQPESEKELVDAAEHQSMTVLKLRCRRVKAVGHDHKANYDAIHRGRYLRNWTDGDGAVRFDARLSPDEGARLVAVVKSETGRLAKLASRSGVDEPAQALAADALVGLACGRATRGSGSADGARRGSDPTHSEAGVPSAMVHVRVDHAALVRGHLESGEICEIPGIGPIPVEIAHQLSVDSILSVLLVDGKDVTTVAHAGRTIPAALRRALCERDPTCVVPGCDERERLEIDHVEPVAVGGETSLSNLARLCHWHHYLKTHHRHQLTRSDEGWRWESAKTLARAGPSSGSPI